MTAPDDVQYKTADEAASYAISIAERYKAENPQVVSVELLPLETAMQQAQAASGEVLGEGMVAFDPADAAEPTWRVVLNKARFHIPRCPASGPGERENRWTPADGCGWLEAAVMYFSANGQIREIQLVHSLP